MELGARGSDLAATLGRCPLVGALAGRLGRTPQAGADTDQNCLVVCWLSATQREKASRYAAPPEQLDREATRLGVTQQSIIKFWLAATGSRRFWCNTDRCAQQSRTKRRLRKRGPITTAHFVSVAA